MLETIKANCGVFFYPQLLLSVLIVGILVGYLVAWMRRELPSREQPWQRTLDPLSHLAVSIGLLGSVVGFVSAFGSFRNGIDVASLTGGLATAYYTTAFGLIASLVAAFGSYLLGLLHRPAVRLAGTANAKPVRRRMKKGKRS